MVKKLIMIWIILFVFVVNLKYFKLEIDTTDFERNSFIGLTIDGSSSNTFPSRDSGLAIDNIICDKGATGVWDYSNWGLKIRNVSQSRTKCQINFVSKYSENILNGADPVLKEGLIPITIDSDGTVRKASLGWEWYKYEEQRWANAVILEDENQVYRDGQIIPESNIESYFVWIPRYKYKIWNMGEYEGLSENIDTTQVHQIEVVFGTDTTVDSATECRTPMLSGESGNCSIGKYMTHPAFLSFGTNGMWVGKFETGYKGANTTTEAEQNPMNETIGTPEKVIIKPNVYSWRGIQVSNAFWTSYNYKRDYNSHMMKNTEWGAVAYLQHSQYGSHESVRINNNEAYITGYAAVNEPSCGYTGVNEECNKYENIDTLGKDGTYTVNYFNSASVVASTTGNYSGVYDMSGGAWEYVMGVMLNSTNSIPCSGRDATSNSGFNGPYCNVGQTDSLKNGVSNFPTDTRYYDTYAYSTVDEEYNRKILGDATGEMGPFTDRTYGSQVRQVGSWHDDEAWFVWSWYPWFYRGARFDHGSNGGVLAFGNMYGSSLLGRSFRIVLSV
ncbi:MAG: hypothetical protein HFI34_08705 [Lachnospiraceae bacterium]|nr:hypothetical protein [Lachnospiraceae bacterium]